MHNQTTAAPEGRSGGPVTSGGGGGKQALAAGAGAAPGVTRVQAIRPRWLGLFLGRVALRVCPSNKAECASDRCQLWMLCKCSREEFERSSAIEARVWAVVAVCGAAVLLYWLLAT